MTITTRSVLLSASIAAITAIGIVSGANAATDDAGSKFKTFEATPKAPRVEIKEATPKAPRVEPDTNRQIVVEPRQERVETPVANLNPPVDEQLINETEPQLEAAAKPKVKPDTSAPEAPEDVFAPQTKAEAEKVEMPTVFTEKQKSLFEALGADEQKQLVEKLVKKYGYDTMYPKNVTRKYVEDYKAKQSYADRDDHYSYNDTGYNSYSSGYGSGYANCQ